jgi:transcriptional accessory protein Tex/SPT6
MILALLKIGKLSMEDIAEAAEVSLDYIKKIAEELNKKTEEISTDIQKTIGKKTDFLSILCHRTLHYSK